MRRAVRLPSESEKERCFLLVLHIQALCCTGPEASTTSSDDMVAPSTTFCSRSFSSDASASRDPSQDLHAISEDGFAISLTTEAARRSRIAPGLTSFDEGAARFRLGISSMPATVALCTSMQVPGKSTASTQTISPDIPVATTPQFLPFFMAISSPVSKSTKIPAVSCLVTECVLFHHSAPNQGSVSVRVLAPSVSEVARPNSGIYMYSSASCGSEASRSMSRLPTPS